MPGVAEPGVLDVDDEVAPLPQIHRRRARLGDDELRCGDRHWWRDAILARQGLTELAVDDPSEVPLGRVDELRPRHVRRRVVEYDRELDDELPAGGDDGEVVEGEEATNVGERMRNRSAVIEPVGIVAHIAEVRAGGVEVVRDRDGVQVVRRPAGVDDGARPRIDQDRDRQRVGEGDADGGRGLARRILLVDFLDRDQEVLAALLDRAGRAVDEPDRVPKNVVARHLARVHDVVEDDQPPIGVLARLREEAEVGGQRVGCRKVPDRAVTVDIYLRGRNRVDKAIDQAAAIGNAAVRPRRGGGQQRQCEGGQQDSDPAVAHPHLVRAARSHVGLRGPLDR